MLFKRRLIYLGTDNFSLRIFTCMSMHSILIFFPDSFTIILSRILSIPHGIHTVLNIEDWIYLGCNSRIIKFIKLNY